MADTLFDELRADMHEYRAIAGELGARIHTVTLIKTLANGNAWDGPVAIAGTTEIPLVHADNQPPKVRWLTQRDYLAGYPPDCVLELTITPGYTATIEQIQDTSELTYYLVTGPGFGENGTKFRRGHLITESALTWKIGLKRISTSDKGTG